MPDDTLPDNTLPDDTLPPEPAAAGGAVLRLGVVRAPDAAADVTLATIDARVVRAELERRLGPVTLDLRTAGTPAGPWMPIDHAAWPSDVDATIDLADLDGASHELAALFGRTVEPSAADVRRRMLEHLSILPIGDEPLTDDRLDALLPPPARPTDLWLVVRDASSITTTEPAHTLLRTAPTYDVIARLDRWFDAIAADLDRTETTIARLRAEVIELRARLADAEDALMRSERLALDRLSVLETERASLRERLERANLDIVTTDPAGPDE